MLPSDALLWNWPQEKQHGIDFVEKHTLIRASLLRVRRNTANAKADRHAAVFTEPQPVIMPLATSMRHRPFKGKSLRTPPPHRTPPPLPPLPFKRSPHPSSSPLAAPSDREHRR
ncbi:hypothetical protein DPEC_G00307570 [Dallia pectoralis]|uniref:Uncharacterized protein n=1 Tax=Dallia pectoralis TaxID=75939 RepID=A0ACC2FEF4_DALPE|nr:hypothetical protein DPEC_G00307570 [Dallia pectoralis]